MGNRSSKSSLRQAIIYLNISADEISANDDKFWSQIFAEEVSVADDVLRNITIQEIRMLRDGSPKNFATLAYKMVERLCLATGTLCNTQGQQTAVLNATKILIRMLPCIFEDCMWRHFFEDNSIGRNLSERDSSGRQLVCLKYPEKKQSERNYTAYVPLRASSRSATPTNNDKQSQQAASGCCRQPQATASKGQTRVDRAAELLLADLDGESCGAQHGASGGESKPETGSATGEPNDRSLMETLILSICDLLFCPEFTVLAHGDSYLGNAVDGPPEDLKSLSTHDYVWEPGVGFDSNVNSTTHYDKNRAELLRALLVCLSSALYETAEESIKLRNNWMEVFVSARDNRHTLPLFTSLLNVVFGYKQARPLLALYESNREQLVEVSCQLLIAVLDYNHQPGVGAPAAAAATRRQAPGEERANSFIEYMSRIHRDEDLVFLIKGFIRLLKGNLEQATQCGCRRRAWSTLELDQELQMLLWKICNLNKKFVQFLLKSNDFLDVVVPVLYHLNENFQEPSRTALIHLGVFNLLLLSGERNFGVRLNKQYSTNLLNNLPDFQGSHADLMILVFHKLIMYGHKINQLYDYLLTILVNVSPYLKGATILACKCLIQLFETFSSVFVLFTEPNYHQLVIFLLEIFNNLIQYQFDGNANLVYMILTKKEIFQNLVNLPVTQKSIDKVMRKLAKHKKRLAAAMEQQQQQQSPGGRGGEHGTSDEGNNRELEANMGNSASNNQAGGSSSDDIDSLELSLATVSCSSSGASSGLESGNPSNKSGTSKREVCLVATPDLQHTTQSVHPFDNTGASNNRGSDSLTGASSKRRDSSQRSEEAESQCINLDDLLGDSSGGEIKSETTAMMVVVDSLIPEDDLSISVKSEAAYRPLGDLADRAENEISQQAGAAASCDGAGGSTKGSSSSSRWAPTSAWLQEWKQSLPVETVYRMIGALEPQLEQLRAGRASGRALDETEIIKFLQNGTLVGLLPVPHPIQIRKYRTNDSSTMWLRACTWGIIYVRATIWTGTEIKLIKIL